MTELEKKLHENKNRNKRESLLSSISGTFSEDIKNAQYSSNVDCIKFAAFSTWDQEKDLQTTTRGLIEGWSNLTFSNWLDLIKKINDFKTYENLQGWFLIDTEGPYYQLTLDKFLLNIDHISQYCISKESYDFAWIGSTNDCGIISEFDKTSFCSNDFQLSTWGLKLNS